MELGLIPTYRIYYHRTENRSGDFGAVFGVFFAAHHAVVPGCEHCSDCAEDDDGEDGDDDAGPCIEGGDDGLHDCGSEGVVVCRMGGSGVVVVDGSWQEMVVMA